MDVGEVSLVEESVNGLCHAGAHAEDCSVEISTWAQVRDRAEELWGVSFFLEWVVGWSLADELDAGGVYFPLLTFSWRFYELSSDADG